MTDNEENLIDLDHELAQNLQDSEEIHCGTDKDTISLINMLTYNDNIHLGIDEPSLILANQLQKEMDKENSKPEEGIDSLKITNDNFPSLSKPNQ